METKDDRRRRKLGMLISATEGGLEAVAISSKRSPEYLKQIIKGVLLPAKKDGSRSARSLGDDVAESLEDAYDLGRGWFDSDRPVPSKAARNVNEPVAPYQTVGWPFMRLDQLQWAALDDAQRQLVEDMILQFLKVREPPLKHLAPGANAVSA